MQTKKSMPPTYLLISVIAMLTLHLLLPVVTIIPLLWNLFGIIPLTSGVVINLLADTTFYERPVLVTGCFRISRNNAKNRINS